MFATKKFILQNFSEFVLFIFLINIDDPALRGRSPAALIWRKREGEHLSILKENNVWRGASLDFAFCSLIIFSARYVFLIFNFGSPGGLHTLYHE